LLPLLFVQFQALFACDRRGNIIDANGNLIETF